MTRAVLPTTALTRHFPMCVCVVMSESYRTQKWIFAQDVWEAQNPVDVLSVLPLNVRQILQRFYIFKRPLNVMWAFLRMTIGLPIELVIKILQTDHG